jgi:hypothetical protein
MYGMKCPMCRQKITKSSYKKIKKSIRKEHSYKSRLTESEFYHEMFRRSLQNTADLGLPLTNQNVVQQYQELFINLPGSQMTSDDMINYLSSL